MARSGRVYTVTWNGLPTHQHPPLHLWLVARTFDALGERDLAARLPTVLLALGTLALTWRIGVLTVGRAAAVTATACLLATPIFVDNARRLMMEVPLTFWITATVWVYLEARRQPRWQVALAVPLGAAILTKSVLGLMPLLALVGVLASEELRAPLRRPWVWIGIALGLAHRRVVARPPVVDPGIGGRRVAPPRARGPAIHAVLPSPRPLRLPADPAEVLPAGHPARPRGALARPAAGRGGSEPAGSRPGRLDRPPAGALQPVVLPDAAVHLPDPAAARPLRRSRPRRARPARRRALRVRPGPGRRGVVALLFWWNPSLLTRDPNAVFKRNAATIQALAPAGEPVPYLGEPLLGDGEPPPLLRRSAASRPRARRPPRRSRRRGATAAGSSW